MIKRFVPTGSSIHKITVTILPSAPYVLTQPEFCPYRRGWRHCYDWTIEMDKIPVWFRLLYDKLNNLVYEIFFFYFCLDDGG